MHFNDEMSVMTDCDDTLGTSQLPETESRLLSTRGIPLTASSHCLSGVPTGSSSINALVAMCTTGTNGSSSSPLGGQSWGSCSSGGASTLTMKEYDEQLSMYKKENFDLKLQIYLLEEKDHELGVSKKSRTGEWAEFLRQHRALEEQLERVNRDNATLLAEVDVLRKDVGEQKSLLRAGAKTLERERAEAREQAERLAGGRELEVAGLEATVAHLKEELTLKDAQMKELKLQLENKETLDKQLEDLNLKIINAESHLSLETANAAEKAKKINVLEKQIEGYQSEAQQLREELNSRTTEWGSARRRLETNERLLEQATREVATRERALKAAQKEAGTYKEMLDSQSKIFLDIQIEVKERKREVQSLRSKLAASEREVAQFREDYSNCQEKLRTAEGRAEDAENQFADLVKQTSRRPHVRSHSCVATSKVDRSSPKRRLLGPNDTVDRDSQKLAAQLQEKDKQIAELEASSNKAAVTIRDLISKMHVLEKEKRKLSHEAKECKSKMETFAEEVQRLHSEQELIKSSPSEENEQLLAQLEERDRKLRAFAEAKAKSDVEADARIQSLIKSLEEVSTVSKIHENNVQEIQNQNLKKDSLISSLKDKLSQLEAARMQQTEQDQVIAALRVKLTESNDKLAKLVASPSETVNYRLKVSLLRRELSQSVKLSNILRIRLEELVVFLEQVVQNVGDHSYDSSSVAEKLSMFLTPERRNLLQRTLDESRELCKTLSSSLHLEGGHETIADISLNASNKLISYSTDTTLNDTLTDHLAWTSTPRNARASVSDSSVGKFLLKDMYSEQSVRRTQSEMCNTSSSRNNTKDNEVDTLMKRLHEMSAELDSRDKQTKRQEEIIQRLTMQENQKNKSDKSLAQKSVLVNVPKTVSESSYMKDISQKGDGRVVVQITESDDDDIDGCEEWSEPDRTVSLARMGLSPQKTYKANKSSSKSDETETETDVENVVAVRTICESDTETELNLVKRVQSLEQINSELTAQLNIVKAEQGSSDSKSNDRVFSVPSHVLCAITEQREKLQASLDDNAKLKKDLEEVLTCYFKDIPQVSQAVQVTSADSSDLITRAEQLSAEATLLRQDNARLREKLLHCQSCLDTLSPVSGSGHEHLVLPPVYVRQRSEMSDYVSDHEQIILPQDSMSSTRSVIRPTCSTSPDLGIESDTGKELPLSSWEECHKLKVSKSSPVTSSKGLCEDCAETRQLLAQYEAEVRQLRVVNASLEAKLLKTKQALERTLAELVQANRRKEKVERAICTQLHKTHHILRQARINLEEPVDDLCAKEIKPRM